MTSFVPIEEKAQPGLGQEAVANISFKPAEVARVLTGIVVLLLVLHTLGLAFRYLLGDFVLRDSFVEIFSFDKESNVPTWYSSSALLLSAVLLGAIARSTKALRGRYVSHWTILCLIFVYLSVDEAAALHEHADRLRGSLQAGGVFYYSWVIPAAILVALFAVAFFRFLLALPVRTRRLFAISGLSFVAGALGLEMVSAAHAELFGEDNLANKLISTGEELLEMMSIVLFTYTLLDYMRSRTDVFLVSPATGLASRERGREGQRR